MANKNLNISVPRYTSYPVITDWKGQDEPTWINSLKSDYTLGTDVYIHIPFCKELCYYCGCFRKVTKNQDLATEYVHYLKKEWSLYLDKLPHLIRVNSIHLGGGTPSFLSAENLENLLEIFNPFRTGKFNGSIELDPRTVSEDQIKVLKSFGFKKASLGIQDFDMVVQDAINRKQSFDLVKEKVSLLRENGFEEINFDLIWGLPYQTAATINKTFEKVVQLKPERISFFSYAHLPDKIKNQRLIEEDKILQGNAKLELFQTAQLLLQEHNYIAIGMDHYALKGTKLHQAYLDHNLYRNFMGYVEQKSDILLGLGVSSISKNAKGFIQNKKDFKSYYSDLDQKVFPIDRGHSLTNEEAFRADIIQKLFCQFQIVKEDLKDLANFFEIEKKLKSFVSDKLLIENENSYQVTDDGKKYIRVIASTFDQYRADQTGFSKAI